MATKYARTAGGAWTDNSTWSTASGGAADTTYCVHGDTAVFDANSGNVTGDGGACTTLVQQAGYAGVLSTWQIDAWGSVTLVAGGYNPFLQRASGGLIIFHATGTLTTAGNVLFGLQAQAYTVLTCADAVTLNYYNDGDYASVHMGPGPWTFYDDAYFEAYGRVLTGCDIHFTSATEDAYFYGSETGDPTNTFARIVVSPGAGTLAIGAPFTCEGFAMSGPGAKTITFSDDDSWGSTGAGITITTDEFFQGSASGTVTIGSATPGTPFHITRAA